MSIKRTHRKPRRTRAGSASAKNGRWLLLPGGGFGLLRRWTVWDGNRPA